MIDRILIKQNARQNLQANIFSYVGLMFMPFIFSLTVAVMWVSFIFSVINLIYNNFLIYGYINVLAFLSLFLAVIFAEMFLYYWFVVYSIYVHANNGARVSIFYVIKDHFTFVRFINFVLKNLASGVLIFLWSLLFFIPGIIKVFSYAMVPFLAIDEEHLGVIETISKSRRMMAGHKTDLLVLFLSFILWLILAIFTFGLLNFYTVPYIILSCTGFYFRLKKENTEENEDVLYG